MMRLQKVANKNTYFVRHFCYERLSLTFDHYLVFLEHNILPSDHTQIETHFVFFIYLAMCLESFCFRLSYKCNLENVLQN